MNPKVERVVIYQKKVEKEAFETKNFIDHF